MGVTRNWSSLKLLVSAFAICISVHLANRTIRVVYTGGLISITKSSRPSLLTTDHRHLTRHPSCLSNGFRKY